MKFIASLMYKSQLIYLMSIIIISFIHNTITHFCGTEYLKAKRMLTTPIGDKNERYLSNKEFEPIRIHLDFSYIENNLEKFNKQDLVDLKEKIMPKTKAVFESLLKVQRVEEKLRFDTNKCDNFILPETYTSEGEGVDADLVVFVMIDDTGFFIENGVEAAAVHCLQHGVTRRPVAGYIQFKPELQVSNSTALDYQVWLAIHEVSHILAFSDELYKDYVDTNNKVLDYDTIVGKMELLDADDPNKRMNASFRKSNIDDIENLVDKPVENFFDLLFSHNYNNRRENFNDLETASNNLANGKLQNEEKNESRVGKYSNELKYEINEKEAKLLPNEKLVNKAIYHIPKRIGSKQKFMYYLKTPNLLTTARRHFKCDSLYGVALEYNGGEGTNGAHWSKRFMNTDYMIGDSYGENLISDITLAVFEDSGWYKTDLEKANLFLWGKDAGCSFFDHNCVTPKNLKKMNSSTRLTKEERTAVETKFKREFCTEVSGPVCSTHNIFRGVCAIRKYQFELPQIQRHFPDPKIGGLDKLSEKCPIPIEAKRGQVYYGGSCRVGKKALKYEKVCPECACFISSLSSKDSVNTNQSFLQSFEKMAKNEDDEDIDTLSKKDLYSLNGKVAACFEFKCNLNGLQVILENKTYDCDSDNEVKVVEGYEGKIYCPEKSVICHEKFKCKFGCTERYSNSISFFNYNYKK